jgi:hypothetical protein
MSSSPQRFRLTEVRRAIQAAREAGIVGRPRFDFNRGTLEIIPDIPDRGPSHESDLDAELAAFEARSGG